MSAPVARFLASELARIGFEPEPLLVKLVGSRIADRGETEFKGLPAKLQDAGFLRSKCIHHLGIGACLTEFLIEGLPLQRQQQFQIASLGGIAHTIYALFDSLLDLSGCVPELFTSTRRLAEDPEIHSSQELLLNLVDLYFQKLNAIASNAAGVRALTERTIRKLHAAELQSAATTPITRRDWWRKNALPIVVMALPAWTFVSKRSNIGFTGHMTWLGRAGEFLGWLDDFSDAEKDCASGHANRLNALNKDVVREFAPKVAMKGERVLQLWDLRNHNPALRNTFTVIVWTSLTPPAYDLHREVPSAAAGASGVLL